MSSQSMMPAGNVEVYGAPLPPRFPDILGIGAQKAGTTWLFENLRRHPALWLAPVKELQYFNDLYIPQHRRWTGTHRESHGTRILNQHLNHVPLERRNYRLIARLADIITGPISDPWYGSIFTLARPDQICGEITPSYALLPEAGIEHVLRLSPDVKILFSLRDPIERNWSHARMIARREGAVDLQRAATHPELERQAHYPELIARWRKFVPESRFRIIFVDDLLEKPEELFAEVCGFLGLDFDRKYFPDLETKVHVGDAMDIPDDIYATMKEHMRPIYEQVAGLYPEIGKRWIAKHY